MLRVCSHASAMLSRFDKMSAKDKLRRNEASKFLRENYGQLAPSRQTLAAFASKNIGPRFIKFGRYPLYDIADLRDWAESQITVRDTGVRK